MRPTRSPYVIKQGGEISPSPFQDLTDTKFCTLPGGPNDIVGDHTNGIVDVNGGEHNIITGFGYPTVLPASQYGVIRENADLTLSNIKVWEIYGIANHIQDSYPYQNNLHVQSKNVNITLANSTVTSIVSGSQAVLYGHFRKFNPLTSKG